MLTARTIVALTASGASIRTTSACAADGPKAGPGVVSVAVAVARLADAARIQGATGGQGARAPRHVRDRRETSSSVAQ